MLQRLSLTYLLSTSSGKLVNASLSESDFVQMSYKSASYSSTLVKSSYLNVDLVANKLLSFIQTESVTGNH